MFRRPFAWVAFGSLLLDQATKAVVHSMYRAGVFDQSPSVPLLGDFLRVAYEQNQQGVFGLNYGPRFLYFLLPALGAVLVAWFGLRARPAWLSTAHGFILGGALGNLVDRVRFGSVVDFILFEVKSLRFRWYTFNLADALLIAGIIMVLGYEFFGGRRSQPAPPVQSGQPAEGQSGSAPGA